MKATRSYYDSPFPYISSSYRQKMISIHLCTCCLRRKDHQLPALPSDLQKSEAGKPGNVAEQGITTAVPQLTLLLSLHTSVWAVTRSPGNSAGKRGNLCPSQCPHCTPASALCRMGAESTAGHPWDPSTKIERRWATALQRRTEAESQGVSGP